MTRSDAAPDRRGNFLAGTADGKIFQSVDGGEHWTAFGPGLPVQCWKVSFG